MGHDDWLEHAQGRLAEEGHRAGGARYGRSWTRSPGRAAAAVPRKSTPSCSAAIAAWAWPASTARSTRWPSSVVHRLDVDGIAAYEPALPDGEHHHHVICSACGRVDTFEDDDLERAIARLSERLGYAVREHDVVLRGACAGCAG